MPTLAGVDIFRMFPAGELVGLGGAVEPMIKGLRFRV
jgi:hypothetical protein